MVSGSTSSMTTLFIVLLALCALAVAQAPASPSADRQVLVSTVRQTSAVPVPAPPPTTKCNKPIGTDFADQHFAHAVTGGPYVVTDFKKAGSVSVSLDGSLSHSHFQNPTASGKIVSYKWTWMSKGKMQTATGPMPKGSFPLGSTSISLLVEDQFCNPSEDVSTVTVNSATIAGAYCYYYASSSLPPPGLNSSPKPQYGMKVGDINFGTTNSFGTFGFKANTFAVRCSFFIDVLTAGTLSYKVIHSGPVKIYHAGTLIGSSTSMAENTMTQTTPKAFTKGLQEWQLLYLRPKSLEGTLKFQFGSGAVIPEDIVRHDSGALVPVITKLSKTSESVGSIIVVSGMSFVNGVKVKFGTAMAETVQAAATAMQVRVPAGSGKVPVTVTTDSGVSNSFTFTYTAASALSFPVKFKADTLKTAAGAKFSLSFIAVVKYGPDARLYCGATNSNVYALSLNKNLQVTKQCKKSVFDKYERAVLGLGFNPKSNALKLYFTASTIFHTAKKVIPNAFAGWTNGKVQSVTLNGPTGCFNNDVADVVTGLPVSNHDHGMLK